MNFLTLCFSQILNNFFEEIKFVNLVSLFCNFEAGSPTIPAKCTTISTCSFFKIFSKFFELLMSHLKNL